VTLRGSCQRLAASDDLEVLATDREAPLDVARFD
jgi:hypothetical protein